MKCKKQIPLSIIPTLSLLWGCSGGGSLYFDGKVATKEEVDLFVAQIKTTDGFVPDGYYEFKAEETTNAAKSSLELKFAVEYGENSYTKRFISKLVGTETQYDVEGGLVYIRTYYRDGNYFKITTSFPDGTSSSEGSGDIAVNISGILFDYNESTFNSYKFILKDNAMHAYHESEEGSLIVTERHVGVRYSYDFGLIEEAKVSHCTERDEYESAMEAEYRSIEAFELGEIDRSYMRELVTGSYTI